jgi:uroporphyrinogen decarboxylase
MAADTKVVGKLFKGMLYARGLHIGELDGFERLIASIYGTPDRVPVMVQPYVYAMAMHGLRSRTFFREPGPFINASYNMATYFGFDFWSPVFDFYNIEAEALGQRLIWRENSEPDVDTREPLVGSQRDLSALKPPVPGKSGRMPYVLDSYRRYMEVMGIPPTCYCCSPFTLAVMVRGYVNILRDMRRNPAFAHRLMEFLSMEVVAPWIDRMVGVTNASLVAMSDAWASAPNMTTEHVREFCLPYVHKVIRATNSAMRTVFDTGSWGEKEVADPREILDIKLDMVVPGNGFAALRPFFINVWNDDYEAIGIPKVRAYADEKKVCLILNVRPDLIEVGPPGEIVRTVKRIIREGSGKGRLAILVNLVPPGTPAENVHTVAAAIRQYGRYPVRDLEREFRPPSFIPFEEWRSRDGLPV